MVGVTGSTICAEHGRETSAFQNYFSPDSSPPTSDSDLPFPLPWQPVLGTSPGGGLPASHLYGPATERYQPMSTILFAFIKK